MLDKLSRRFLDYLNRKENRRLDFGTGEKYPDEYGNRNSLLDMIRFLEESGYVEQINAKPNGVPIGVKLTHMGCHWREYRRMEVIKYFEEKWIDFLALVIAVIAFLRTL